MNFTEVDLKSSEYPPLLREINAPPKTLYVRGTLPNPDLPAVAIVGTRKATKQGLSLAEETAKELARAGIVVVSGLAMGIDTAAHKGALAAKGPTIAVLGNGIDTVYPAQNERLAKKIVESGGAIISEYKPGEPSYKGNFIERNRVIAGLSLGVLVIEAPARSGAQTTARFAGEYGRDVFVFPGPARDKHYAGSHALIRDGATLATSASDVLADLDIEGPHKKEPVDLGALEPDERAVIQALKDAGGALSVDKMIERTTLDAQTVGRVVATLVIRSIIEETETGYELSYR